MQISELLIQQFKINGSVAEWSIAPVLKTGNGKPFVSSNLTASANTSINKGSYEPLLLYPAPPNQREMGIHQTRLDDPP